MPPSATNAAPSSTRSSARSPSSSRWVVMIASMKATLAMTGLGALRGNPPICAAFRMGNFTHRAGEPGESPATLDEPVLVGEGGGGGARGHAELGEDVAHVAIDRFF